MYLSCNNICLMCFETYFLVKDCSCLVGDFLILYSLAKTNKNVPNVTKLACFLASKVLKVSK